MQRLRLIGGFGLALLAAAMMPPALAQLPLSSVKSSSQTVTPSFEGWYRNPDGTFSLSFGYFNRNADEAIEIPIGPDNFVAPGDANQGQPTTFEPRRHWGVFAVKVPADFGDKEVTWTLRFRGATYPIPGSLHKNWQIDALQGEAGSGNTPPVLKFAASGPEGAGPAGVTAGPVQASAGVPVSLDVWAKDDGKAAGSIVSNGTQAIPVTLTWFKHQGPGKVSFTPGSSQVDADGGEASVMATFNEAGDYVLRVRANDASGVEDAGHAQCCWTNGFLRVTVTR